MNRHTEHPISRLIRALLLATLFSFPSQAQEKEKNHCDDSAAWADWDARAQRHPEDQELQLLHALWMGLCFKVERGEIALGEAISIFEQARGTLMQKRREEHQQQKPPAPL
jgi:hypothetical protein